MTREVSAQIDLLRGLLPYPPDAGSGAALDRLTDLLGSLPQQERDSQSCRCCWPNAIDPNCQTHGVSPEIVTCHACRREIADAEDVICTACYLQLAAKANLAAALGSLPVPAPQEGVKANGAELIAAERERQRRVEGWTPAHDDEYEGDELLLAALWYLDDGCAFNFELNMPPWPWDSSWWKPSDDPIRSLTKAGALIAAEIDRIQRQNEAALLPSRASTETKA